MVSHTSARFSSMIIYFTFGACMQLFSVHFSGSSCTVFSFFILSSHFLQILIAFTVSVPRPVSSPASLVYILLLVLITHNIEEVFGGCALLHFPHLKLI